MGASEDAETRKGASRREFLAGAGLTGAAVAVGALPAILPVLVDAAPGPGLPNAAAIRPVTAARTSLELTGNPAGPIASQTGGYAFGDVVLEKAGPTDVVRKHLGGIRYEPIGLSFATGMTEPFYQWITNETAGKSSRHNGAVVISDFNGNVVERLEFTKGLITEVGIPALDASSKDTGYMTLKIAVESARSGKGGGSAKSVAIGKQKKWLPANFKLSIDGLVTNRVNRVEPLTWKQKLADHPTGKLESVVLEPVGIEVPNLVVTIPAADADSWLQWHSDFVVSGKNGQGNEKGGTLDLLAPDRLEVLFSLTFENLGIFRLSPVPVNPGSDSIRRLQAEMYCENLKFSYKPGAIT